MRRINDMAQKGGGSNECDFTLPKEKTAILVMDCQNDIVHEDGKFGGHLTGGAMPRLIKEKNILGNISALAAAGRTAHVPIIHVRHAYRPDYSDLLEHVKVFQVIKQMEALRDGTWGADIHADLTPEPEDFGDYQNAGEFLLRQSFGSHSQFPRAHPPGADRHRHRWRCRRHSPGRN